MNSLGKITTFLTILLLIFCYHATRAERSELTTALPGSNPDRAEDAVKGFGLSIEAGGSLSSIMRLAYSDLDLQQQESTWARLVRETISLNEGLIANADPAALHDPAANRVEPGTVLQLPAIAVVEEGDTGIGRVLIRLNPGLKGNGRSLLAAITATIAANADLVRKADVNQLRDGRFNVIVVGDVLILPPEVKPLTPARQPVQQPAMVAEERPAEKAAIPSGEEKPGEAAEQVAAVAKSEPVKTEVAIPSGEEKPEEAADQVAAVITSEPEEAEAAIPSGEEKPEEAAEQVAAVVTSEPDEAASATMDGTPYSAIVGEAFNGPIAPAGPIGLTARETRRPAQPVKKSDLLSAGHLLLAYLFSGLALLGLFIIMMVRWLERDQVFREQFRLLITAVVFLVTLGRVKKKPFIDWTEEEQDLLAEPDPGEKQESRKPA